MNIASTLEFRVLAGGQRGCRVPLREGRYSAGSAVSCDLLLQGLAPGLVAFVLHLQGQDVALEVLDQSLCMGEAAPRGRVALQAGQAFTLGDAIYAVDLCEAAWPEDPDVLLRETAASATPALPGSADETAPEPAGDETGEQLVAQAEAPPLPGEARPLASRLAALLPIRLGSRWGSRGDRPLKRPPFWTLWLAGTAAFLVIGVTLLVALNPAKARPALAPAPTLNDVMEQARDHAQLKLVQQEGGRWQMSGYVLTHAQKIELIRAARAVDPTVRLDVNADEDMAALARDTIARLAMPEMQIGSLHFGTLELKGHARSGAALKHLAFNLFSDVPGLHDVHALEDEDDAALVMLQDKLAEAGLADRLSARQDGPRLLVSGILPDSMRKSWLEIRQRVSERFGALEIVENFREALAPRQDILLSVGGPVPWVVLSTGEKQGRSVAETTP